MPIYQLPDELVFPDPALANEDGIIAVGGDLSPERVALAYECGIFPWFSDDSPIIWWAPDPRFVLFPEKLKVSKSLRPVFNKKQFEVTYDQDFEYVISRCKQISRKGQEDTWITDEMKTTYIELHKRGLAHSVEVWEKDKIVGGLYGVSLGKSFFGESMFADVSNASKVGFITLVQDLLTQGFEMIDCQVHTEHLQSLGAEEIPRQKFMSILDSTLEKNTLQGNWSQLLKT